MNENTNADSRDLQRLGLKVTQPRLKVLHLFQTQPDRHLSAEEVHLALQEKNLGLTTVYRVLAQLEAAGLLKRSSLDTDRAIYELDDGKHHDHLVCVECGRIDEFQEAVIEQRQEEIASSRGFRLVEHALCIYGICADCRK